MRRQLAEAARAPAVAPAATATPTSTARGGPSPRRAPSPRATPRAVAAASGSDSPKRAVAVLTMQQRIEQGLVAGATPRELREALGNLSSDNASLRESVAQRDGVLEQLRAVIETLEARPREAPQSQMSRRSVSEERRAAEERAAAHSESLRKHCARLAIQLAEVTQLAEQQVRTKVEEAAEVQQEAGVRVQTLANESAALRQSLAAANEEVGRLRKQNETLGKARQGGAAERGGERARDSSPRSRSPAPQSGAFGGASATRAAEERSNGKFDGEKDTIDR